MVIECVTLRAALPTKVAAAKTDSQLKTSF